MNDTELRKTIAENLKRFREERKLSQTDLGVMFGKEKTTISTWERGVSMPDIVMLHKLSKLYGVDLEDFYVNMEGTVPKRKVKKYKIKKRKIAQTAEPQIVGRINGMPIYSPASVDVSKFEAVQLLSKKKPKAIKAAKVSENVKGSIPGETGPATI